MRSSGGAMGADIPVLDEELFAITMSANAFLRDIRVNDSNRVLDPLLKPIARPMGRELTLC